MWLSFNEHNIFSNCVCVCVFHRVVGPAVTFKVRPNTQNISTTDVANVAGRFSLDE